MSEVQLVRRNAEKTLRLRIEAQTEAKMRLVYAEQAMTAAKNGFNDLYEYYTKLAKEAHERQNDLATRAEKAG